MWKSVVLALIPTVFSTCTGKNCKILPEIFSRLCEESSISVLEASMKSL